MNQPNPRNPQQDENNPNQCGQDKPGSDMPNRGVRPRDNERPNNPASKPEQSGPLDPGETPQD